MNGILRWSFNALSVAFYHAKTAPMLPLWPVPASPAVVDLRPVPVREPLRRGERPMEAAPTRYGGP